jgi:hypothetical protein
MARSSDDGESDDVDDRDDLVALARWHIGMGGRVFYAPSIPPEIEANARFAHDLHLPDGEAILVLHDGTVFGSAEEGFVITQERFCWKNPWESARQITWRELDREAIKRETGKVILKDGEIALSGEHVLGVSRFLLAMTGVTQGAVLGPYRGQKRSAALGTATLPEERVSALGRDLVGEVRNVFYAPSIPAAKLRRARAAHAAHLPGDEPVAMLYDDTYFGSAEEGLVLTSKRLCWKMYGEPATQLPWGVIDGETISSNGSYLEVMGAELKLTSWSDLSAKVAVLLRRIVEEASLSPRRR